MSKPNQNIPVCRPYRAKRQLEYVQNAIQSGWISSMGEYIGKFEAAFACWTTTSHAATCCNGTAAIHLSLLAAGVQPGDYVVVPSFTMIASIAPIVHVGAKPLFVDCTLDTWTLDPKALAPIKEPIKAILPVHIYGHPCDMDPILDWAKSKNAVVIEDAAEAHGAKYKNRNVGSLGDLAAFSFYANKILTTGEGGMITTNAANYADRVRYYCNHCFATDPKTRFIHANAGFNFRMTNVHAAIGLAQMEEADALVEMRIQTAKKYLSRLGQYTELVTLPVEARWARNVHWMFGLLVNEGVDISSVQSRMLEQGIETRRFFFPGHLQPAFQRYGTQTSPNAEKLWNRGMYLPSSSDLTDQEADYVVEKLVQILRKADSKKISGYSSAQNRKDAESVS